MSTSESQVRKREAWPVACRLFFVLAVTMPMAACEPLTDAGDAAINVTIPDTPRRALPICDWAEVVSVTDGDTIRVEVGGEEERVRYIGIDTPEVNPGGDPEPFAEEATAANEMLVAGEQVCLERDVSERDRYGRLLRYVWLGDGRLVNEALVAAGYAEAVEYRPDTARHDSILQPAEDDAIAAERGIWR